MITPSRFSTARDRVDLFLTQINSADNGIRVEAFSYLKNSIVKDVSLMQGRKREFEILGCPLDSLSQRRFKIQLEETTDGMKIFIDGKFKKIISGLTFSDFSSY